MLRYCKTFNVVLYTKSQINKGVDTASIGR